MKVELNIYAAINKLEAIKGERIPDKQIADEIGLHRHTVAAIRAGREDRLLSRLMDYFKSQDVPIELADLFVVTDD